MLAWSSVHGAAVLWLDGPLATEGLVEDEEALAATITDTLISRIEKG